MVTASAYTEKSLCCVHTSEEQTEDGCVGGVPQKSTSDWGPYFIFWAV